MLRIINKTIVQTHSVRRPKELNTYGVHWYSSGHKPSKD